MIISDLLRYLRKHHVSAMSQETPIYCTHTHYHSREAEVYRIIKVMENNNGYFTLLYCDDHKDNH